MSFDLSKAFGTFNHLMLLDDKLDHIGVTGVPFKLFKNYLSNRTKSVYNNENFSDFKYITTGIPQCSILGAILFLIYINDITNANTKFKFTIYTGDTSLLLAGKDVISLHKNLIKH